MCLHDITLSVLTTGFHIFPQSLLNLHSRTSFFANSLARGSLNTSPVEGYWQWKENSGQVWEGSLPVFPVGLSVSMLLSSQLIMQSSGLFFSGPTARRHTFWWRDTDLHHRAPSVWGRAHCQAEARSWYAYWWRALPARLLLTVSEGTVCPRVPPRLQVSGASETIDGALLKGRSGWSHWEGSQPVIWQEVKTQKKHFLVKKNTFDWYPLLITRYYIICNLYGIHNYFVFVVFKRVK